MKENALGPLFRYIPFRENLETRTPVYAIL